MKGAALGSVALTVAFALLHHWRHAALWYSLAITFGTIGYHLAMRLMVGLIFDRCMHNRADYSKPWYRQRRFEPGLHEKLRVRRWKGRMPTYESGLFDLHKHSWDEIAQAMCQAELVHETIAVLSFYSVRRDALVWQLGGIPGHVGPQRAAGSDVCGHAALQPPACRAAGKKGKAPFSRLTRGDQDRFEYVTVR